MRQSGNLKSAVFLDRDGVVNESLIRGNKPFSPRRLDEVVILEGVRQAVSVLQSIGLIVVVVTNQPDIAHGFITRRLVNKINSMISTETGIEHFYVCEHKAEDSCECRKPRPGLLKRAAFELSLSLSSSYLVGDRWKDIDAGQQVGCECFFIDYDYSESRPKPPFTTVSSLLEATTLILERENDK
jgi:D-glycero-D-manno-heptose 1,7-bisphosphate phosphatase